MTLEVSNIMGQNIILIEKGLMISGIHKLTLDGSQLASGIYFYTVKINGESYTHKMVVE